MRLEAPLRLFYHSVTLRDLGVKGQPPVPLGQQLHLLGLVKDVFALLRDFLSIQLRQVDNEGSRVAVQVLLG